MLQTGSITIPMRDWLEAAFVVYQMENFDPAAITHNVTGGNGGLSECAHL